MAQHIPAELEYADSHPWDWRYQLRLCGDEVIALPHDGPADTRVYGAIRRRGGAVHLGAIAAAAEQPITRLRLLGLRRANGNTLIWQSAFNTALGLIHPFGPFGGEPVIFPNAGPDWPAGRDGLAVIVEGQ